MRCFSVAACSAQRPAASIARPGYVLRPIDGWRAVACPADVGRRHGTLAPAPKSVKHDVMTAEDMNDLVTGYAVKPEQRAQRNFNLQNLIAAAPGWRQLAQLLVEFDDRLRFEKRSLPEMLTRAAELDTRMTPAERSARHDFLDTLLLLMLEHHDVDYHSSVVTNIFKALQTLEHVPPPQVLKAFMALLQTNTSYFRVQELFAVIAAITELGGRPGPSVLKKVVEQSLKGMRYATADDISNAATAFSRLSSRTVLDPQWCTMLATTSRRYHEEMAPDALCNLALVLAKQGYEPSQDWLVSLLSAVFVKRSKLQLPGSYPALLYAMAKLGAPVDADILQSLLDDMAKPGAEQLLARPAAPAVSAAIAAQTAGETAAAEVAMSGHGGRRAMAAAAAAAAAAARAVARAASQSGGSVASTTPVAGPSILRRLSCEELAMLASVLSIYGYIPRDAWLKKFAGAIARRTDELSGRQAAGLVTCFAELDYSPEEEEEELVDELLAVSESALPQLPAQQLANLASGLSSLRHAPDRVWTGAFVSAVAGAAATASNSAELASLAAAPAALPIERGNPGAAGSGTAALSATPAAAQALAEAVVARAKSLGGLAAAQAAQAKKGLAAIGANMAALELPISKSSTLASPTPTLPPAKPATGDATGQRMWPGTMGEREPDLSAANASGAMASGTAFVSPQRSALNVKDDWRQRSTTPSQRQQMDRVQRDVTSSRVVAAAKPPAIPEDPWATSKDATVAHLNTPSPKSAHARLRQPATSEHKEEDTWYTASSAPAAAPASEPAPPAAAAVRSSNSYSRGQEMRRFNGTAAPSYEYTNLIEGAGQQAKTGGSPRGPKAGWADSNSQGVTSNRWPSGPSSRSPARQWQQQEPRDEQIDEDFLAMLNEDLKGDAWQDGTAAPYVPAAPNGNKSSWDGHTAAPPFAGPPVDDWSSGFFGASSRKDAMPQQAVASNKMKSTATSNQPSLGQLAATALSVDDWGSIHSGVPREAGRPPGAGLPPVQMNSIHSPAAQVGDADWSRSAGNASHEAGRISRTGLTPPAQPSSVTRAAGHDVNGSDWGAIKHAVPREAGHIPGVDMQPSKIDDAAGGAVALAAKATGAGPTRGPSRGPAVSGAGTSGDDWGVFPNNVPRMQERPLGARLPSLEQPPTFGPSLASTHLEEAPTSKPGGNRSSSRSSSSSSNDISSQGATTSPVVGGPKGVRRVRRTRATLIGQEAG